MPPPMVLATAVPSKKAATKLKKAAHSTASLGERTRVETTVAMLLAASWKPLRKSKARATRTVTISNRRVLVTGVFPVWWSSVVFQDYGFEDVGDIFGPVGGGF